MSEKKYWIDKSSVFGSGKNAVKYGKEIIASDARIAQLVKDGKVGQLPAIAVNGDAKKVIELNGIIAGLKKEIDALKKPIKRQAKKEGDK